MKKINLALFLLLSVTLSAQDYFERAKSNLKTLVVDSAVSNYFNLDLDGISIYASFEDKQKGKPEFFVEWAGVQALIQAYEQLSRKEMLAYYKGNAAILRKVDLTIQPEDFPQSLEGMRIALDPSHMAENEEQAKWEKTYMFIKQKGLFKKSCRFYEADLTYATAALLKKRFEGLGAEVLISREANMNAIGKPFEEWYAKDFKVSLEKDYHIRPMDSARYIWLRDKASKEEVYKTFFLGKDRGARVKRINQWKPDLTLIIHYNTGGPMNRVFIEDNYSMAFVPGGFSKGQMDKLEKRMDFLRLLVGNSLEQSMKLGHYFVAQNEAFLGVPPIEEGEASGYLNNRNVASPYAGVYCRNFNMTRKVRGPVISGMSLLLENIEEAQLFEKMDLKEGDIRTSKRVEEVAEAYFRAVAEFTIRRHYQNYGSF